MLALLTALTGAALAAPPSTGGTWALELTLVSAARIPVLGEVNSSTVSHGLLSPVGSGDDAALSYEVCDVSVVDRGSVVTSSIPEAFVRALPVRSLHPTTVQDDEGWRYRVDLGSTHVGYDPALSGGVPPSSADHPATRDSDGDGAPGATVVVSIPLFSDVDIHITQGTALVLDGRWIGDDLVRGSALVSYLEQHVLGASNRLFARSPSIRPVHELSTFTLSRVPDSASCDELVATLHAGTSGAARVLSMAD
jgi:hypothetical protein